jgi:hypothetical protein
MQIMHYLVTRSGPHSSMLGEVELLTGFLSAASHDVGHPGLNNDFLCESEHDYAIIYNNQQCLENFHASQAFLICFLFVYF